MKNQIITKEEIENAARETFGATAPVVEQDKAPLREPITSFTGPGGAFRCNVEMMSFRDKKTGEYGPYQANISTKHNGKFGSLPVDPVVLREFAGWLVKIADVVDGAPSRDVASSDVDLDAAKDRIAKVMKG